MPQFKYSAKDLHSHVITGKAEAEDRSALARKLQSQGLFLINSHEIVIKSNDTYKMKTVELHEFNRELAAMLASGISLIRSLNIMIQGDIKPAVRNVYKTLYTQIQQGVAFSEALESMKGTFPELMIQMYRAGEASGNIEKIAEKLSNHYSREMKTQGKIKSATTYPIILAIISVIVMVIIFTFVLPNFFTTFDSFGAELPGITKFVMGISTVLTNHFLVIAAVVAVIVFLILYLRKMPSVRFQLDKFKVHMPKIGKLMRVVYTARFARSLSSMYTSGLSMLRSLEVTAGTIGNEYISSQFAHVAGRVRNGASLSQALSDIDGFDNKLISTVYIGEESGRLDEMLDSVAETYEYESERATEKMITMIEPTMICILAVLIGAVMLAVMVPVYTLYTSMSA